MENITNSHDKSSLNNCKESVLLMKTSKPISEHSEVDNPKSSKTYMDYDGISVNLLETMKDENNRLSSFGGKWPLKFINAIDLAKAGFFYLQLDDRVQCAYCRLILYSWKDGDIPLVLHIKESPECRFFVTFTSNVPAIHNSQVPLSNCNNLALMPSCSDSHRPKTPHMSDIKRRLSTFQGWPLTMMTAEKLSECGFYYTGLADVVTCFFCGGSLGSWEPFDNPMTEHSKFYPNCEFLRLLCGHPMQKETRVVKPFNTHMQNSEQSIEQAKASEFLKSDIIQEAKEIFPSSLVHDVVLQYFKQTGKTFTSLSQLCKKILEQEENRLRINEVKDKQSSRFSSHPGTLEAKSVKDAFLCKICMDREMGIVFQPCGHLVTCEKCADLISECPLCRKPIDTRLRTYLS